MVTATTLMINAPERFRGLAHALQGQLNPTGVTCLTQNTPRAQALQMHSLLYPAFLSHLADDLGCVGPSKLSFYHKLQDPQLSHCPHIHFLPTVTHPCFLDEEPDNS